MTRPMSNLRRLLVLACLLSIAPPAGAANRFWVEDKNLQIGPTGQTLTLGCDNDIPAYGFSLTFVYQPAKIRVTGISLTGSAIGAGWSDLKYDNATGVVIVGVVMDITNPLTTFIPAGTNHGLVQLTLDVVATSQTTTLIHYQNRPARPDGTEIRNILTDGTAITVTPTLEDRTISILETKPIIVDVQNNSGKAGKEFNATCENLDIPGITIGVRVCGVDLVRGAEDGFGLLSGGRTLWIIAPACGTSGWVPLVITTDYGSDTVEEGFNYSALMPPSITSLSGNEGAAGKVFQVTGENFNRGTLAVKVGGVTAAFTLRADDTTLDVTAPAGSPGWAALEICNSDGCDTEANGFHYVAGTSFVRGDSNGDGELDLSDAIGILGDLFLGSPAIALCRDSLDADDSGELDITDAIKVLNHLFLGASPPSAPYPDPGLDPSSDDLPSC
jgi:hypothetical protein